MNLLKKLFAIFVITFCAEFCFAELPSDLQAKFDTFKVGFQNRIHHYVLLRQQLTPDSIMHHLTHLIPHDLQPQEISSLKEQAVQYGENRDVVSLFMLAAFMSAYIPKIQLEEAVKFMMMLQVTFDKTVNQSDVPATDLLNNAWPHFDAELSEIQINKLIKEASELITYANRENHTYVKPFPYGNIFLSTRYTLTELMVQKWSWLSVQRESGVFFSEHNE
ncbi:hypothetical protein [Candidatus Sororendozoicomonas aggregata]|uniref:hypothetical protein n=1 Tax=Candidatus Sororendozoicomonas aggregata TaxID=3073239 RepID=UPI002ED084D6